MTLLITVFAAIASTIVWYFNDRRDQLRLGMLTLMFWGASLMWMCDAVAEYLELGAEYFMAAPEDMLNDSFLGFSVIALGMVIWIIALIIKDPKGVIIKKKAQME